MRFRWIGLISAMITAQSESLLELFIRLPGEIEANFDCVSFAGRIVVFMILICCSYILGEPGVSRPQPLPGSYC